jgi:hypothetical protein
LSPSGGVTLVMAVAFMSPLGAVPGLAGQMAFTGAGVSVVGAGAGPSVVVGPGSLVGAGVVGAVSEGAGVEVEGEVGATGSGVVSVGLVVDGSAGGDVVPGAGVVTGPGAELVVAGIALVGSGVTALLVGPTGAVDPVGVASLLPSVPPQPSATEIRTGAASVASCKRRGRTKRRE